MMSKGVVTAAVVAVVGGWVVGAEKTKTEAFDRDPGWEGVNNRSARTNEPRMIRQDFGYSATNNAGGKKAGEAGGYVSPAGECAYYGMPIPTATLEDEVSLSGTMYVGGGSTHLLLGLFNHATVNEWRTPNTISMRINARGEDTFFAYVEYCTSNWKAGGDTTPFPHTKDENGRWSLNGFPTKKAYPWTLTYDPKGNDGKGVVRATVGDASAECKLDDGHKATGATFDRFGILNIMKSADGGSEFYIDDVKVNGKLELFDRDPKWDARNNRRTYPSKIVRPMFDFGYSAQTHFAGGKRAGEMGGQIFRGDCRYPERMGCYGDKVGPLTLDKPLRASGKIAMTRGVTDSTALFGFYNAKESMRQNPSQSDGVPESVLGVHLEGPSSEGFLFYPVYRVKGGGSGLPRTRNFPPIYPDGKSHDWVLEYNPAGAEGKGQIKVTLDGKSATFDLEAGAKERGTTFDRFGIVTSWIDGNSVDAYWDDVTYTVGQ